MEWLWIGLAVIVSVELLLGLPWRSCLGRLIRTAQQSTAVLRSQSISDLWKERASRLYAKRIMGCSLSILCFMAVVASPFLLAGWVLGDRVWGRMGSWEGIVGAGLLAVGWAWFRTRSTGPATDPYTPASKILHELALGSSMVGQIAFDIERTRYLSSSPSLADGGCHVFVTGLARSGTTILMRELHRSREFASLCYSEMPFPMCPNTWHGLSRYFIKPLPAHQRAHGDGIWIDQTSPEALDEVFWRIHAGKEYIHSDRLCPHSPSRETVDLFAQYMQLIMRRYQRPRYLSKNNNHLLRLRSLHESIDQAVFLIPIRHPVAHASSLRQQHLRFSHSSRFVQRYMGWLVHHEFGADHRPVAWLNEPRTQTDPCQMDYWLEYWMRCYRSVQQQVDQLDGRVWFVPYETLCTDDRLWSAILDRIGISQPTAPRFVLKPTDVDAPADASLTREAQALYHSICSPALEEMGISS